LGLRFDGYVETRLYVMVDQQGPLVALGVAGIDEVDIVLRSVLLRAAANDVPEGIAGDGVGDHGDGDLLSVGDLAFGRLAVTAGGLAPPGGRARSEDQQRYRQECDELAEKRS